VLALTRRTGPTPRRDAARNPNAAEGAYELAGCPRRRAGEGLHRFEVENRAGGAGRSIGSAEVAERVV